ncbi:MAG: selenocysteine-specific translation elongation factor [Syntrophomonadaceae bacterium]|jgi:selenocysteine-specific elongation factor|nr:selenocysteine-specific translation elongation factor [Syntrophomonadaceae bacterium]
MKRLIIGTAGHIDHGKTALVRAMTGLDTDRLKEEKKRGISIELGFAPLTLPSGQRAGIVDVPGHERFVRQMLAGAFGMDLVLLIVAADEGIMPQTREHLDIIRLLGINQGIVVITKKDLVDEEWLMMVEDDIKEYLATTELKEWPIITVSSTEGAGIPELLRLIEELSAQVQEKSALGQVRLPIDRVFSMTGFGTVVTGTLWSGRIRLNDSLQILPQEIPVRVRTLHVHNQKVEEALAGQRVAVNLQGVDTSDIHRGNVLAAPGFLSPTYRISGNLRLLKNSPRPLKNWTRVRFHLGTDECLGRVVLLEHDELQPGEHGYVQIVMEEPVVCTRGDRFVIRFYSPVTTIGGGVVIDPHPPKQKRFNEAVLEEMAVKEEGDLEEVVLQELNKYPDRIISVDDLAAAINHNPVETRDVLKILCEQGLIEQLKVENHDLYLSSLGVDYSIQNINRMLEDWHKKYPLRPGFPREELRSRYFKQYPVKVFNALISLLEAKGVLSADSKYIRLPGQSIEPDRDAVKAIKRVMEMLDKNPLAPPGLKEIQEEIADSPYDPAEIIAYLEESGQIVKVAEGVYYSRTGVDLAWSRLNEHFDEKRELSLAEARDMWETSRKYTLPLLEYFDRIKYTKRIGDNRIRITR